MISDKKTLHSLCKNYLYFKFLNLEFLSWKPDVLGCDESNEDKRVEDSDPNLRVTVIAWSGIQIDFKGIHYARSNSDKFKVNISMYTLALFMDYPDNNILYASLKSFDS